MSSWTNRQIARKRDISKIPIELLPNIIPRNQQPQIILSESFQHKDTNEIIYPSPASLVAGHISKQYNTHYSIQKIDTVSSLSKELQYKNKSYVFVILRTINSIKDNDLWITAYNSIRKFYTNRIVIIDDDSLINTVNGKLANTDIIMSDFNGAGTILPYYYFLKNKWADKMIFLHDNMFINRPFKDTELDAPVAFHWHNNTQIKDEKKFLTYLSLLRNYTEIIEHFHTDSSWKGCFGGASIIDFEIIQQLETKYSLFSSLLASLRNKNDRDAFGFVFGLILHFEKASHSNFGNILHYPNAFESHTIDTANILLTQSKYDTAIMTVWR